MKPLVIYHKSCADGFGAAYAAWLHLGNEAEYLPMQYGLDYSKSENTFEFKERDVYILDFSFPRDIMDMLFSGAKKVVWLDHHKTAFEMVDPSNNCIEITYWSLQKENDHVHLDNNKSGALLAWKYFHPDVEPPALFKYIDDYDRWQFKLEGTKEFNKAIWSHTPWKFTQWRGFDTLQGIELSEFRNQGAAILRAHDQNVEAIVRSCTRECEIYIHTSGLPSPDFRLGLMANCPPHLQSDVGHALANQSGTYGLLWSVGNKGKFVKCSLRSNGDYDVSAIAKSFGGGGHKNAAGFEVPLDKLLSWMT